MRKPEKRALVGSKAARGELPEVELSALSIMRKKRAADHHARRVGKSR